MVDVSIVVEQAISTNGDLDSASRSTPNQMTKAVLGYGTER